MKCSGSRIPHHGRRNERIRRRAERLGRLQRLEKVERCGGSLLLLAERLLPGAHRRCERTCRRGSEDSRRSLAAQTRLALRLDSFKPGRKPRRPQRALVTLVLVRLVAGASTTAGDDASNGGTLALPSSSGGLRSSRRLVLVACSHSLSVPHRPLALHDCHLAVGHGAIEQLQPCADVDPACGCNGSKPEASLHRPNRAP